MSSTDTLAIVRQYGQEQGWSEDKLALVDRVLTEISDERSIPLKLYSGGVNLLNEVRQVLDPQRVTITNMKGTRGRVIEIGPGTNLIYGPNDAGKTTILKAILYALGGAPAAGVGKAEDLMTHGTSEMEVVFEFFGGVITRGCSRRVIKKGERAGTTEIKHTLSVQIGGDKADKPASAQALIDGWLGVDPKFVRSVACLEQGEITRIMDEQPAPRRENFYRMLSLDAAEQTFKSLSGALQEQEDILVRQAQDKERRLAQVASLRDRLAKYPVADFESRRADVAAAAAATSATPQQVNEARAALERRIVDMSTTRKADGDRIAYARKLDELKRDPAFSAVIDDGSLERGLATEQHAVDQLVQSVAGASARLDSITARATEIKALPDVCPMCAAVGKSCELSPEAKAPLLAELRKSFTEASIARKGYADQLQAHRARQAEMTARAQQQDRDSAKRKFIGEQIALLEQAIANLPVQIDTAAIERDVETLRQRVHALESLGTSGAVADLATIDRALAEARAISAQIVEVEKQAAQPAKQMQPDELSAFRAGVIAFAKDGIPLWLARKHLKRINEIAEEASKLDRYRYSFGENLEIRIQDTEAQVIGPELASGSSRERGAVILAAARGRYLQERCGLSIPMLWVDELPFQDDANGQLVIDIIKKLIAWYPKIVLCASRWDDLVGKFDNEIALRPEQVSIALDAQRMERDRLAEEGQGQLAPPPAPVTTYGTTLPSAGPRFVEPHVMTIAEVKANPMYTAANIRYVSMCDAHDAVKAPDEQRVQGPCAKCARGDLPLAALTGVDLSLVAPDRADSVLAQAERMLAESDAARAARSAPAPEPESDPEHTPEW